MKSIYIYIYSAYLFNTISNKKEVELDSIVYYFVLRFLYAIEETDFVV